VRGLGTLAGRIALVAVMATGVTLAQTRPRGPAGEVLFSQSLPSFPTVLPFPTPLGTEEQTCAVTKVRERFPSGHDRVAVEVYTPPAGGPFPVVILLHGARPRGEEAHCDALASDIARHGLMVLRVHYYDRGRKGRGTRSQWQRCISDALTFASTLPGADASRNAVVGFSLGAFLALSQAPSDTRIGSVVAFYGGIAPGQAPEARRSMPPVLLLHGTADRIVPVRRSLQASELLHAGGRQADLVIYPGVRHGFCLNSRGGADRRAAADGWRRTIEFLIYHLACAKDDQIRGIVNDATRPRIGVAAATLPPPLPWTVPSSDTRTRVLVNPDSREVAVAAAAARPRHAGPHRTKQQRSASAAEGSSVPTNGS
jgi:carboxymethylenebutenolidase